MRVGVFFALVIASFLAAASFAYGREVDEDFTFELYRADVFPWITGEKSGHISDHENGEMAAGLGRVLGKGTRYVDLAVYGIHNQDWLFDTLGDLVRSGLRVRAVVDQRRGDLGQWVPRNFAYPDTSQLASVLDPGHVLPDLGPTERPRPGSIMHNKFMVVDRRYLWLGSTNFSQTGLGNEYNANTSLLVDSPTLARLYANEFHQMFTKKRFSLYKNPRSRRYPLEYRDGTRVQVFFSPQDNTLEAAILPFIERAQRKLAIAMFYLTDDRVAEALIDARRRGVDVQLIYDALAAAHPSTLHHHLRRHGVEVRVENWGGKMHMKTAVADSSDILIGSMNWSEAGSNLNDENTLLIRNNRRLARMLTIYFNKLWRHLDHVPVSRGRTDPAAESHDSINSCHDGIDNDFDGRTDGADAGCSAP